MKNRVWVLLSVFLLVSIIGLIGCTADRRPITPAPGQTRTVPGPTRVTPPTTPAPGVPRSTPSPTRVVPRNNLTDPGTRTPGPGTTTPTPGTTPGMPGTTGNNQTTPGVTPRTSTTNITGDRAKKIASEIAKEKNIKSASCVVNGNTAVVGLQFDEQYKGKVTDAIKQSVNKRVKDLEPTIKKVIVTADPDLLSRIKTVARDIEKGKPLTGFTKEIEEIIRRINPF